MKRTTSRSELGGSHGGLASALPVKPLASSEVAIPLKAQRLQPVVLPGTPPVPPSPLSDLLVAARLAACQASTSAPAERSSAPAVVLRPHGRAGHGPAHGNTLHAGRHAASLAPTPLDTAVVVSLGHCRRSGAQCRLSALREDTSSCFFSIGSRPRPVLATLHETPPPPVPPPPQPAAVPLQPPEPAPVVELTARPPLSEVPARRVSTERYAADDLDGEAGWVGRDAADVRDEVVEDEGWGDE